MSTSSEYDVFVFLSRRLKLAISNTLQLNCMDLSSPSNQSCFTKSRWNLRCKKSGLHFCPKQSTLLESLQTSQLRWACPKNASYASPKIHPKKWLLAFWSYVACTSFTFGECTMSKRTCFSHRRSETSFCSKHHHFQRGCNSTNECHQPFSHQPRCLTKLWQLYAAGNVWYCI